MRIILEAGILRLAVLASSQEAQDADQDAVISRCTPADLSKEEDSILAVQAKEEDSILAVQVEEEDSSPVVVARLDTK